MHDTPTSRGLRNTIGHTATRVSESEGLTVEDAWRWMLSHQEAVLFVAVVPTVVLLVTDQRTKIQAFTAGAGEFALWKSTRHEAVSARSCHCPAPLHTHTPPRGMS